MAPGPGNSPPVNDSLVGFSKGGERREWHVSAARPIKDGLAFNWQRTFFCCGLLARACNAGFIHGSSAIERPDEGMMG